MRFALVITCAPFTHPGAQTALRFATAALEAGHGLYRVFFYEDGVHTGDARVRSTPTETPVPAAWQALAREHGLDLVLCSGSAARRGMLDQTESDRRRTLGGSIADGFALAGLGQLLDATLEAERVLWFGP